MRRSALALAAAAALAATTPAFAQGEARPAKPLTLDELKYVEMLFVMGCRALPPDLVCSARALDLFERIARGYLVTPAAPDKP